MTRREPGVGYQYVDVLKRAHDMTGGHFELRAVRKHDDLIRSIDEPTFGCDEHEVGLHHATGSDRRSPDEQLWSLQARDAVLPGRKENDVLFRIYLATGHEDTGSGLH